MNKWVSKSIKLASSPGYLDNLTRIYPIDRNHEREIDQALLKKIETFYKTKDYDGFTSTIFQLEKFPIDNPYVGSLKVGQEIRSGNPLITKRIADELFDMGFEEFIKRCQQPKSSTRQFGPFFKNWLFTLGYKICTKEEFEECTEPCFLYGSDTFLKKYANEKLNTNLSNLQKGLDFIFKKDNRYVIGEAKFISTSGGNQGNQLNVALTLAEMKSTSVSTVAVVDGAVWLIPAERKKIESHGECNIMSVLLLPEFLKEF